MSIAGASGRGQRIVITLLLTVFCLQAAQGSFCSELTITSAAELATPAKTPCHGDDEENIEEQCCLACISMAVVTDIPLLTVASIESNVTDAIQFNLASRLELLYRPPSNYLS